MRKPTLLLCALVLLAGCGRRPAPGPPPGAGGRRPAPANGRAAEIHAIYMSGIYADSARELAVDFEKATGIRVAITDAPYLNLHEKEVTDLVTGTGTYDVLQVASQWDGEILPRLRPIDDEIRQDDPGADDFIPAVWENSGKWEGKTYGLPCACDAITLFYRTDVFRERNAAYRARFGRPLAPPKTWEEYLNIARYLHGPQLAGNTIMGLKEQDFTLWSGIFWGSGGELVDAQWRPTLASDLGARTLGQFVEMFRYAQAGADACGIPEANAHFLQGRGAMYMTWPSLISAKLSDPRESKVAGKVAAAVIPGRTPQLSAWSLAITKTCANPAAAYRWVKFYVSAENTKRLFKKYGKGPTRVSTYRDPEFSKSVFYLPQVLEGLQRCRARFRIRQSQEMCDYLDSQISEAVVGRKTPRAALQETAVKWSDILSKAGLLRQ
jgi:multiple sugar transport system substrate-binding protein